MSKSLHALAAASAMFFVASAAQAQPTLYNGCTSGCTGAERARLDACAATQTRYEGTCRFRSAETTRQCLSRCALDEQRRAERDRQRSRGR